MGIRTISTVAIVAILTYTSSTSAHANDAQSPLTNVADTHINEQPPTTITTTNQQQPLYTWNGPNAIIWVSHIQPTFFNQDAEGYDYEMINSSDKPIESIKTLNHTVYTGGDEHAVMVALLNTTMGGIMTEEQANDDGYLCSELGDDAAAYVPACMGRRTVWERFYSAWRDMWQGK